MSHKRSKGEEEIEEPFMEELEEGDEPVDIEDEEEAEIMGDDEEAEEIPEADGSDIETGDIIDDDVQGPPCDIVHFESLYSPAIKNNTTPYITKFEMAKIVGLRIQQLAKRAPPTVDSSDFPDKEIPRNLEKIAKREIAVGKCPFIIRRPLPNGIFIDVPVSALIVPSLP